MLEMALMACRIWIHILGGTENPNCVECTWEKELQCCDWTHLRQYSPKKCIISKSYRNMLLTRVVVSSPHTYPDDQKSVNEQCVISQLDQNYIIYTVALCVDELAM